MNPILGFLVLALCFHQTSIAQNPYNLSQAPKNEQDLINNANRLALRNPFYDHLLSDIRNKHSKIEWQNAVGSPYLSENFNSCKIYVDQEFAGDFYYRYNAYNDEIEIKHFSMDQEIQSLHTDKKFRLIDGKKEISLKTLITKNNEHMDGYVQLVQDGDKYKLYLRTRIKFTEARKAENSMVRSTPNKFTNYTEYYVSDGLSDSFLVHYLDTKKNNFILFFDEAIRARIKKHIKDNKIDLNREEDLMGLFTYLNER